MILKIQCREENSRFKLNLWLPNSIIKWKIIWKNIAEEENADIEKVGNAVKSFYKELQVFLRHYGHFTLVEANSPEGYVKISF